MAANRKSFTLVAMTTVAAGAQEWVSVTHEHIKIDCSEFSSLHISSLSFLTLDGNASHYLL